MELTKPSLIFSTCGPITTVLAELPSFYVFPKYPLNSIIHKEKDQASTIPLFHFFNSQTMTPELQYGCQP
jgi:hypothetical protein